MSDPSLPGYQSLLSAIVLGINAQLVYEIGVGKGYSTVAILTALTETGGRLASCDIEDCQGVIPREKRANWSFYRCFSEEFIELVDRPADVVYIDGSHEYANVRADVLGMWPLLKMGGVMILHDTTSRPDGPGRVLTWLQHRSIEAINIPTVNGFGIAIKNVEGLLLEAE